jgi:hypothetical protein
MTLNGYINTVKIKASKFAFPSENMVKDALGGEVSGEGIK